VGSLKPVDILLLISELEGSFHHLRINGFTDDMDTIDEMKKRYYKLYFKLTRESNK
jgi:hypothetical protein